MAGGGGGSRQARCGEDFTATHATTAVRRQTSPQAGAGKSMKVPGKEPEGEQIFKRTSQTQRGEGHLDN